MNYQKQLTAWFPGNVKPARKGLYQRIDHKKEIFWSKWDGEFWCAYSKRLLVAESFTKASMFQDWEWRGLAKDPTEGGAV